MASVAGAAEGPASPTEHNIGGEALGDGVDAARPQSPNGFGCSIVRFAPMRIFPGDDIRGPGCYTVDNTKNSLVKVGVKIREPERPSSSFASRTERLRREKFNDVGVPRNLHSSEYDKRIWRTSSGTIPRRGHDPDSFMRPTTGAKLFYETMAQAPTDIGARLVSTPIKYNYMKTVYPRYPATKLKFQYDTGLGPGTYKPKDANAKLIRNPKRQSSMFKSKTRRFAKQKHPGYVGGDWNYSLFGGRMSWMHRDKGSFSRSKRF